MFQQRPGLVVLLDLDFGQQKRALAHNILARSGVRPDENKDYDALCNQLQIQTIKFSSKIDCLFKPWDVQKTLKHSALYLMDEAAQVLLLYILFVFCFPCFERVN